MRRLQQYAEVIVTVCVVLALLLCGALYYIFEQSSASSSPTPSAVDSARKG